jgi:hypothetical protein
MTHSVTLIIVESVEDEAFILKDLSLWTSEPGTVVAPVLNQGGLPRRLLDALRASRVPVNAIGLDRLSNGREAGRGAQPLNVRDRPGAVLLTAGVDAAIASLAASLCGTEPLALDASPADLLAAVPADNRTALLLFNPESARAQSVLAALAALARAGVQVGIIYCMEPLDARFMLLKSLLVGRVEAVGRYAFITGERASFPEGQAPGWFGHAESKDTLQLFERKQDVLFLHGHSNALDAALAENLILCARQGELAGTSGTSNSSQGLFPCFQDGLCFRQPLMGRSPSEATGLVAAGQMSAGVIILSGCNLTAPGQTWVNVRRSLTYQCGQGTSLALMATAALIAGRLEWDFLCLALMAEGLPLGEVMSEINRVRTQANVHTTGLPDGVGPYLLFGNPCLRLAGLGLQETTAVWLNDATFYLDLSAIPLDREHGTILRVKMPPGGRAPYLFMRHLPQTIWCRGILHARDGESTLYLWLTGQLQDGEAERVIIFDCYERDPLREARQAVERFASELYFWVTFLDSYLETYAARGFPGAVLREALAELPGAIRVLSQGANAMQAQRGLPVSQALLFQEVHTRLWQEMNRWSEKLLALAVDIACTCGTLQSINWEPHFRLTGAVALRDPCPCGDSWLAGTRFESADGGRIERVEYQCSFCGPAGEDDGRRLVQLISFGRSVRAGDTLEMVCACRALDDEMLQVHLVLVLESWLKDRRIVGSFEKILVEPGEQARIELSVQVPLDLGAGVYPCAVLGVVNGALYIMRRMVEVLAS